MIDRIPLRAHYVTKFKSLHAATDQSIKFGIWPNQTNPVLNNRLSQIVLQPVFTVSEPIKHEHKYVYTGKKKLRRKLENIS
jgi:hypothetical protein